MTVGSQTRHMPGSVLAAAILLGLFGGLTGLGLTVLGALKLGDSSDAAFLLITGFVVIAVVFATVTGYAYRSRFAQIGTVAIGMIGALGGITQVMAGNAAGILWLGLSVALCLLVAAPMPARMWFTR